MTPKKANTYGSGGDDGDYGDEEEEFDDDDHNEDGDDISDDGDVCQMYAKCAQMYQGLDAMQLRQEKASEGATGAKITLSMASFAKNGIHLIVITAICCFRMMTTGCVIIFAMER